MKTGEHIGRATKLGEDIANISRHFTPAPISKATFVALGTVLRRLRERSSPPSALDVRNLALGIEESEPVRGRRVRVVLEVLAAEIADLPAVEQDGELDAEALDDSLEHLAGVVLAALDEAAKTEAPTLEPVREALERAIEVLIRPLWGKESGGVATRLSRAVVYALLEDPAFRSQVQQRFQERTDACLTTCQVMLGEFERDIESVVARLDRLAQHGASFREALREILQELHGAHVSPADREELATVAAPGTRRTVFRTLRKCLCSPLRSYRPGLGDEIADALRREGKDPDVEAEAVPDLFAYLPHRLERLMTVESNHEREVWKALEVGGLVRTLLTEAPSRVLVVGKAGFGKTTFLHHLAHRMTSADSTSVLTLASTGWGADAKRCSRAWGTEARPSYWWPGSTTFLAQPRR